MHDVERVREGLFSSGFKKIAGGAYGNVYARNGSDRVVKIAYNDGTRTYLEWVQWRTKLGKRMKGMPELDMLVQLDEQYYLAVMKRYSHTLQGKVRAFGWADDVISALHQREGCPKYIKELACAFAREAGGNASDLHYQNMMYDKCRNELVVIDPSSAGYVPFGERELYIKQQMPLFA